METVFEFLVNNFLSLAISFGFGFIILVFIETILQLKGFSGIKDVQNAPPSFVAILLVVRVLFWLTILSFLLNGFLYLQR